MSHQTKGFDSIAPLSNSHALGPKQDVHFYSDLIEVASGELCIINNLSFFFFWSLR